MPDKDIPELTQTERIDVAQTAIAYVLRRIVSDPDAAYVFGYGTESLRQLCRGYAALSGESFVYVEARANEGLRHVHGESLHDRLTAAHRSLEAAGLR